MENQDPRLPKEINISEKSFAKEGDYITQKENDENLSPQIHLLSHSQYALWLNYQMMGEKRTVYNMGFATQILSPLDISALQKSCDRLGVATKKITLNKIVIVMSDFQFSSFFVRSKNNRNNPV